MIKDLALCLLSAGLWLIALVLGFSGYLENDFWLFVSSPVVAGLAWVVWPSGHLQAKKSPWSY